MLIVSSMCLVCREFHCLRLSSRRIIFVDDATRLNRCKNILICVCLHIIIIIYPRLFVGDIPGCWRVISRAVCGLCTGLLAGDIPGCWRVIARTGSGGHIQFVLPLINIESIHSLKTTPLFIPCLG